METISAKPKEFSIESLIVAQKLRKLTKMVKPLLKLLSRRARTNAVAPTACTYDIEESLQNEINEPFDLSFRFHEDENAQNEALERRLQESVKSINTPIGICTIADGQQQIQPVLPDTYFAVPVHFIEAPTGGFLWVPLADADIAPHLSLTESQLPSQQVPCVVV